MPKSKRSELPNLPSRSQIEELRSQASADLERAVREPLSEKVKLDLATLEAVKATKH
jgi:hypothetical protein